MSKVMYSETCDVCGDWIGENCGHLQCDGSHLEEMYESLVKKDMEIIVEELSTLVTV